MCEAPLWTVRTDPDHVVHWAIRSRRNYREALPGLLDAYPHLTVGRLRSQRGAEDRLAGPPAGVAARPPAAGKAAR